MSYPSKDQLKDIAEYIGSNLHLPQLVQHFDKSNIYDTDEKMIGQWIDLKPIYKKTIVDTMPASGEDTKTYPIGSNVDEIVDVDATIKSNGSYFKMFTTTGSWNAYYRVACNSNSVSTSPNSVVIKTSNTSVTTYAGKDVFITVYYTKTTDSPVTYIVDDEYEPRVEHCDTFDQNNPSDVTVTFNLGSGSQLIDADELVLYQASSGSFVAVNTVKYNYTFTSIWLDSTAGFMNNTKLEKTPMRIIFNKDGVATKVVDFILPVILK